MTIKAAADTFYCCSAQPLLSVLGVLSVQVQAARSDNSFPKGVTECDAALQRRGVNRRTLGGMNAADHSPRSEDNTTSSVRVFEPDGQLEP